MKQLSKIEGHWLFNESEVWAGTRGLTFKSGNSTTEVGWRHVASVNHETRGGASIGGIILGIILLVLGFFLVFFFVGIVPIGIGIVVLIVSAIRKPKSVAVVKTTSGEDLTCSGDAELVNNFLDVVRKDIWGDNRPAGTSVEQVVRIKNVATTKTGQKLKMLACPYCGSENKASAKFCNNCGSSLEKPAEAPEMTKAQEATMEIKPEELQCSYCGAYSPASSKYCDSCGKPLGENRQPKKKTPTKRTQECS